MSEEVGQRKNEHIFICLNRRVESGETGFAQYRFLHNALPEVCLDEIDTSVTLFGKKLSFPLMIAGMTGGTAEGKQLNLHLAQAAQRVGVGMGVGSQRAGIEKPEVMHTYAVREVAPDILLFGNLGLVQLNYGYGKRECLSAVESIQADGLALHVNAFQESAQREGDTDFRGLYEKLAQLAKTFPYPIILKEVGFGISSEVASRLLRLQVQGIDVAGSGGTNWAIVEGFRRYGDLSDRQLSFYTAWGIPTVDALVAVRPVWSGRILLASGGIRTGLDVAKALALGADATCMALPLLRQAAHSTEAVEQYLREVWHELRVVMFALGCRTVEELKQRAQLLRSLSQ